MVESQTRRGSGILPPTEQKVSYVRSMFGLIASRYDLMNHVMTLGRDNAWRRCAVAQATVPYAGLVLDVATGTGDLGLEVLRQQPSATVAGVDFTPEMLAVAKQKSRERGAMLALAAGDALHLPFPEGRFDAVVTGFALRNVTDIPLAFAEMARVTRPGGRIACLEIAKPRLPLWRRVYALYFYRLVPLLGSLITGHRAAYTYLPHSLTAFLTPDEIVEVMRRAGWREVSYRRLMLGTVALHSAVRE